MSLHSVTSSIARESSLFLQFSWRDWSTTLIPACLFIVGPLNELPYHVALRKFLTMVLWDALYIYGFNLFDQISNQQEDRINKPDRPLPSGRVTVAEARKRCVITWTLFFLWSIMSPQLIPETIVHALCCYVMSATPLGGLWVFKSCTIMALMTWSQYSAVYKIISPLTTQSSSHLRAVACWNAFVSHSQDFRDQLGDLAGGRRTLPIVFGDKAARWILALLFMPLALRCIFLFGIGIHAPFVLGALHAAVSYRILAFRNAKADHKTYMVRCPLSPSPL